MSNLPTPSLSATIDHGVYASRVTRVRKPRAAQAVDATPKLQRLPRAAGRAYRVIGVSIYTADPIGLDAKVRILKRAGLTWMTRSELIRIAAQAVDVEAVIAAHRT